MLSPPTPVEINRNNRKFWDHRAEQIELLFKDWVAVKHAVEDLHEEVERGLPLCHQRPFEVLLEQAARKKADVMFIMPNLDAKPEPTSSSGGVVRRRGPSNDPLNLAILDWARGHPQAAAKQLYRHLASLTGCGVIMDVNPTSIRVRYGARVIKEVPTSGLKDRLHRARMHLATLQRH